MEGAAQKAAGEGQELGWGHRPLWEEGRPGPSPRRGLAGGGQIGVSCTVPNTLGASSRYCDPEPMVTRRGKLLSCST